MVHVDVLIHLLVLNKSCYVLMIQVLVIMRNVTQLDIHIYFKHSKRLTSCGDDMLHDFIPEYLINFQNKIGLQQRMSINRVSSGFM